MKNEVVVKVSQKGENENARKELACQSSQSKSR